MTIILDGTTGITTPAINSSGDLELPGGTANGVLYLNGSKVATSGSALVFDGTNLGVGASIPTSRLNIEGTANNVNSEMRITATGVASGYFGSNSGGLNIGVDLGGIIFKTGVTGGGSVGNTGTERARMDASGYLLVGATASDGVGDHRVQIGDNGATAQLLVKNSSGHAAIYSTSANNYLTWNSGGFLALGHSPTDGSSFTERAQITSDGNIVINGGTFLTKTSSQSLTFFADPSIVDNTPRLEINGTSATVTSSHTFIRSNTIVFTANAAASERGRFDSSGRWLVSSRGYQPRFLAERAGDQTGYNATSTGDVVVLYNSEVEDIGSNFNTSTGKFTAPVDGMYIFQASAFSAGGTAFTQSWLVVNGVRKTYTDNVYTNSPENIAMGTFIIYLNANDTVGFHPYNATDTNQTITANVYHTWFKGYLIG